MKRSKFLTSKEVAQLMGVPLVTVYRWAHQGKIPCKLKNDVYIFKKNEIISWAKSHNFYIIEEGRTPRTETEYTKIGLSQAIAKGGVFYDLGGNDIYSVLKSAVDKLPITEYIDKDKILNELLNREEIASTGIGKGVAIPHPRRPLPLQIDFPIIPVFFLKNDIDFNSVDGEPVFVLFLIFSNSTQVHLKLLAKLSFCLREKKLMSLLHKRVDKNSLLSKISEIEKEFGNDLKP